MSSTRLGSPPGWSSRAWRWSMGWASVRSTLERKCSLEIGGGGVAGAERREVEPVLDEAQDRGRVIGGVVDEVPLGERGDDHGWNAGPRTPAVTRWRAHVVPEPAVLVVGEDDRRRLPGLARHDALDQRGRVRLTVEEVCIARVLVVGADRLVGAHRRKGVGADGLDEIRLVLEVGSLAGR